MNTATTDSPPTDSPLHRLQAHRSRYRRLALHSLPKLCDRTQLPALFNAMRLFDAGVEVGVQAGEFASLLREQWCGVELHLVDRWRHEPGYQDTANVSQEEQERLYQQVLARFAPHPGVHIIREESVVAAQGFKDGSLDWVYLDADHSREAVAGDLTAWWPKLKSGGVLAGHDYFDGVYQNAEFGVKSAVDAFALHNDLDIVTTAETLFCSWYCRKP